jgi:hypothetical protein
LGQAERPVENVGFETVLSQYFGQPSPCLAAPVIKLEQPILSGRVAEAEEQVGITISLDVRHTSVVSPDSHPAAQFGQASRVLARRHAPVTLRPPPSLELCT